MEITDKDKLVDSHKILIAHIDGLWTTEMLINYLTIIESFEHYYLRKFKIIEEFRFDSGKLNSSHLGFHIPVKSIQYRSPGWIELILPATSVVSILAFLKHYIPNKKEKAEIKKIESETIQNEIRNLKELGFHKKEIVKYFLPRLRGLENGAETIAKFKESNHIKKIEEKKI